MRSHPSCWNKTLAQLGFKRKRRKPARRHDYLKRRSLFENLEQRQMLSGDPLFDLSSDELIVSATSTEQPLLFASSKPKFVLIQPEIPQEELESLPKDERDAIEPVFVVETVETKAGSKAVISFNPNSAIAPSTGLQRLTLEVHELGSVVQSYEILIDIAEEEFREQFLADRVAKIAADTEEITRDELATKQVEYTLDPDMAAERHSLLTFVGPMTMEQTQRLDDLLSGKVEPQKTLIESRAVDWTQASTEELVSVAKRQVEQQDIFRKTTDRTDFYTEIEKQTQQLKQDRTAATTEAEQAEVAQKEQTLKRLTLLLAQDLQTDLKSDDRQIVQAAQKVRDELVAISDSQDLLFAGFNVDNEIERRVGNNGSEKALSFVETGRYIFDDKLEIDLGEYQAMVQVTRSGNSLLSPNTTVRESPDVEDGSTDEINDTVNGGAATSLHVDGTANAQQETVIRFSLDEFGNPTTIADAQLQLSEIGTGAGDAEVYVWNGLYDGQAWDETNVHWEHIDQNLGYSQRLSEFTQVGDWAAGSTTEVDVSTQVQRALLYGDANGDGAFAGAGYDGDIEAFHLAVTNWDAYVAEYGPRANSASDLIARTDGGLGDGTVDTDDVADFFRRHGYSQGDYNLDGTVQDNEDSGIDGLDWAIFNANYGLSNARFTQGDGNFDGVVDDDDYDIWFDRKHEDNLTPEEPELIVWVRPEDSSTDIEFASQEHATLDGPTLVVNEQPDLALNKFSVDGSNLVVDYAVFGETFTDVKVQLYKAGTPDTLLHETAVQSGTLGSHEVLIATSVLASIVEGDSIYAKVVGTPSTGSQINTTNDQLDFEFSTDSTQTVNSLDDAGMDNLLRNKHTLRELLEANESLGWFDTLTFDDDDVFVDRVGVITLGDHSGDLVADRLEIDQDVTIAGPDYEALTIDAHGQTRGIVVGIDTAVTIQRLAITGGYSLGHGAGIYNKGSLSIDRVGLLDNNAQSHGGGIYNHLGGVLDIQSSTIDGNSSYHGGGISGFFEIGQSLTVNKSTISNNTSSNHSGGLSIVGTAGANPTEVLITNSTFSGNESGTSGGALRLQTNTDLTIIQTTITDNTAVSNAGGIQAQPDTTTTLHNSVLAGNHIGGSAIWATDASGNIGGTVSSPSTGNFIGIGQSGHQMDNTINTVGTTTAPLNPMLEDLGDFGGYTPTHMPKELSPIIGMADPMIAASFTADSQTNVSNEDSLAAGSVGFITTAGPIMVTDSSDSDYDDPTDNGTVTLREAIDLAKRPGHDVIEFDADVFSTSQIIQLRERARYHRNTGELLEVISDGSLKLDQDLTISGPGADLLSVVGADGAWTVFSVSDPETDTINVEISELTVTGGSSGISNTENLTLDSVAIKGNEGLGINHSGGTLTMLSSEVSGNVRSGIRNSRGTLIIQDSVISDNGNETSPYWRGGGIYNLSGTVNIERSTIAGNKAQFGGGIASIDELDEGAHLEVIDSTVSGNSATSGDGGGIFGYTWHWDDTTWKDNPVVLTNSTVSGNSAAGDGGGVYTYAQDLRFTNATVTENRAATGGGVMAKASSYPILTYHAMEADNTIIAGNTLTDENTASNVGPGLNFWGYNYNNLIGTGGSGGLTNGNYGNQVNVAIADVGLAPLGNYGGPTQTHALLPGSFAIDAGSDTVASSAGLTTDQRGFDRSGDYGDLDGDLSYTDIGAVEYHTAIWREAENFDDFARESNPKLLKLALEVIGDPTASMGRLVSIFPGQKTASGQQPVSGANYAEYDLTLAHGGSLTTWIRVIAPDADADSLEISVNNATPTIWNASASGNDWQWLSLGSLNLVAGHNTLKVIHNENSVQVDKFFVTSDSTFVPNDLGGDDPEYASLDRLQLTATVRDFNATDWVASAGSVLAHPDFEESAFAKVNSGSGIASEQLNELGKPTIAGQHDDNGIQRIAEPGDFAISDDPIDIENSFNFWFADDPRFSRSINTELQLVQDVGNGNLYHFVGAETSGVTAGTHEFYPIDGLLLSDPGLLSDSSAALNYEDPPGTDIGNTTHTGDHDAVDRQYDAITDLHNAYFTLELEAEFTYYDDVDPDPVVTERQFLDFFKSDDDLWVYIDGKLWIDNGGVHQPELVEGDLYSFAQEHGLISGESYSFHLFHAQRNKFDAHLAFDTNIELREPEQGIKLSEGSNLVAEHLYDPIEITSTSEGAIQIDYSDLDFDIADVDDSNDAFELALLYPDGSPAVATIRGGRDAFFNITEISGEQTKAFLAPGVVHDAASTTVTVDVAELVETAADSGTPITDLQLVARLVNNDHDQGTSVMLAQDVSFVNSPETFDAVVRPILNLDASNSEVVETSALDDVTDHFAIEYTHTSYDEDTGELRVGYTATNTSSVGDPVQVRDALYFVVEDFIWQENGEGATVAARETDGTTSTGSRFYNLNHQAFSAGDAFVSPGETVSGGEFVFYAPEKDKRFDFDIRVLGHINDDPYFINSPEYFDPVNRIVTVGVDETFEHPAKGEDPDHDAVKFRFVTRPNDMAWVNPIFGSGGLESEDGKIAFTQQSAGVHPVEIEIFDEFGGASQQDFTVVFLDSSNLAPYFIEPGPAVDAYAGEPYAFTPSAIDPDQHYPLRFELDTNGTDSHLVGLQSEIFDPTTGKITWTPAYTDVGETYAVEILVFDSENLEGVESLSFEITVHQGNAPQIGEVDLTIDNVMLPGNFEEQFNRQTLTVEGVVTADIHVAGTGQVLGPFDVTFFEDRDFDQLYDPEVDQLLGSTTVEQSIQGGHAPEDALTIAATLDGQVQYAGAIIWAFVDSGNVIVESSQDPTVDAETNNYAGTHEDCYFTPIIDPVLHWNLFEDLDLVDVPGMPGTSNPQNGRTLEGIAYHGNSVPVVADLNGDGYPEILYTSDFSHEFYSDDLPNAALYAIDVHNNSLLWTFRTDVDLAGTPAVGDIDSDEDLEVLVATNGDGSNETAIIAIDHLGVEMWESAALRDGSGGNVSLADLENDGFVEVIVGASVLEGLTGQIRFEGNAGYGLSTYAATSALSVVADLNGDGIQEVIAGNSAYAANTNSNGDALWTSTDVPQDGFVGVANFDTSSDNPEIAIVFDGKLQLLDHLGNKIWANDVVIANLPDSNGITPPSVGGGPPVIGNFDDEPSTLEIGVGTTNAFTVFRSDGSVLEQYAISDFSSSSAGASAFDLNGDGTSEIFFSDEEHFYIFDARNPIPVFVAEMPSATASEYPVPADIDGDGTAEIIVSSNTYGPAEFSPGPLGVSIFKDRNNSWTHTRNLWNQHSYHINNVLDDDPATQNINEYGSIPALETPSWLTHNTYRQNSNLGSAGSAHAPDLIPSFLRINSVATTTSYTVRIGNGGSATAPTDAIVQFYHGDPTANGVLLASSMTTSELGVGRYEDVSATISTSALQEILDDTSNGLPSELDLWVVVDPDEQIDDTLFDLNGAILECRENNNLYRLDDGIVVPEPNNPPVLYEIPDQVIFAGDAFVDVYATAEDPDMGHTPIFDFLQRPLGMEIHPTSGEISWNPSEIQIDRRYHSVTVRVRDGHGGQDTERFSIDVKPPNQAPVLVHETQLPDAVLGVYYEAKILTYDPYETIEEESFIPLDSINGATWNPTPETLPQGLSFYPPGDGEYYATISGVPTGLVGDDQAVELSVVDSEGLPETRSFRLNVVDDPVPANQEPVIVNAPRTKVQIFQELAWGIDVVDPENNGVTITSVTGLRTPEPGSTEDLAVITPQQATDAVEANPNDPYVNVGKIIYDNVNHVVYWTPGEDDFYSVEPIKFTVQLEEKTSTTNTNTNTHEFLVYVSGVAQPSLPPEIIERATPPAIVGEDYSIDFDAIDPERDYFIWQLLEAEDPRMSLDPRTGKLWWEPGEKHLGTHTIQVAAIDSTGRQSVMDVEILVRSDIEISGLTPLPPILSELENTSFSVEVGETLTFEISATHQGDQEGPLFFELVDAPQTMYVRRLSDTTAEVVWKANSNEIAVGGNLPGIQLTVQNQYGTAAATVETFDVSVLADTSDPEVILTALQQRAFPDMPVSFLISVLENHALCDVRLVAEHRLNAVPQAIIPVSSYFGAVHAFPVAGIYDLTVTVVDEFGQDDDFTIAFEVLDPSVYVQPIPQIIRLFDPSTDNTPEVIEQTVNVEYQVDNSGVSANPESDPENVDYVLELLDNYGRVTRELARGTGQVSSDTVAINPTTLPNGGYSLRLTAINETLIPEYAYRNLYIDSGTNKLGNFSVSFTDLETPVAGIPFSVTRTYDSLLANVPGDFGYGWTSELVTGNIDVQTATNDQAGHAGYDAPLFNGSRITVTLPGGETHHFTTQALPQNPASVENGKVGGILGTAKIFALGFRPAPGQLTRLDLVGGKAHKYPQDFIDLLPDDLYAVPFGSADVILDSNNNFRHLTAAADLGIPFNPATPTIGLGGVGGRLDYRLSFADGTEYLFNSKTGKLISATLPNENELQFTSSGGKEVINAFAPGQDEPVASLNIVRVDGRITEIVDSQNRKLTYEYDETGNLQYFRDRVANLTSNTAPTATFYYGQDEFDTLGWDLNDPGLIVPDHILTTIENALGIPTLQVGFDSDGRVRKIRDAADATASFGYTIDLTGELSGHTVESISDDNGVPTEIVRDPRGNIIRRIQRVEVIDEPDSPLSTEPNYNDLYLVSVFGYDDADNQTKVYEPFQVDENSNGNSDRDRFYATPPLPPTVETFFTDPNYDDLPKMVKETIDGVTYTTTYEYDERGRLEITKDAFGNENINLYDPLYDDFMNIYDAAGGRTYVEFELGQIEFTAQITDSGRAVNGASFSYDSNGRLEYSSSGGSPGTYYVYDYFGNQTISYTHWLDDSGDWTLVTRTDYDEANRVYGTRQYTLPGERFFAFASDLDGDTPDWFTHTEYDANGRVLWTQDRFENRTYNLYDIRGNIVETRTEAEGDDLWIVSRTYYDNNGRAVVTSDPMVVFNDSATDLTLTDFDPSDDELRDPNDNTPLDSTDYRATHTVYDDIGRVVETRRLHGLAAMIDIVQGSYNDAPVPGIFLAEFEEMYDIATAVRSSSQTTYDDQGRVFKTISPDGLETYFEHDSVGRQKATIQGVDLNQNDTPEITFNGSSVPAEEFDLPDGGPELVRTTTSYDALGRQEFSTDAKGTVTKFEYDAVGRVEKTIADYGLDSTYLNLTTQTKYNSVGQRWLEIDPLLQATEFKYDHAGRLMEVLLPEVTDNDGGDLEETLTGSTVGRASYEYKYDDYGNQTEIKDPNGNVTKFTYDYRNRQVSRTLPIGVDTDGVGQDTDFVERMFYDDTEFGNLVGPVEASAGLGQLAYSVDFERRVTKYLYDNSKAGGGRLVEKIDYGVVTGLALSAASLKSELESALMGLSPARTVSYAHDALGRTTEITDSAFTTPTTHEYDIEGRLTQLASPQGTINYEYDELGRMTRTYTGGESVAADPSVAGDGKAVTDTRYTYDELGRLQTVTVTERNDTGATGEPPTTYYYDKNGNLDATKLPNDVIADYVYDDANRLKNLIHFTDVGVEDIVFDEGFDTLVSRFDYELRDDGKRTQEIESDTGGTVRQIDYVYDELGRLVEEAHDAGTVGIADADDFIARYGYDLNGNRLRRERDNGNNGSVAFSDDSSTTYVYDENDRLEHETTIDDVSANDRHIVYTYEGTRQFTKSVYQGQSPVLANLLEVTTMLYDERGRLQSIEVDDSFSSGSSVTTTYEYNDSGIRVSSHDSVTGETTTYHVDPNNRTGYAQVLEEGVDTPGAEDGRLDAAEIDRSYALGHDIISQAEDAANGAVYFFLYDGHGSTRTLLNWAAIAEQFAYDAYGNMLVGTDALTRFLYSGEQTDPTGMQYLRARYYNPTNGRFNRLDPFAGNLNDPQSLHKYLYTHADPVNGIDPSGLISVAEVNTSIGVISEFFGTVTAGIGSAFTAANSALYAIQLIQTFATIGNSGLITTIRQEFQNYFSTLASNNAPGVTKLFTQNFWERATESMIRNGPAIANTILFSQQAAARGIATILTKNISPRFVLLLPIPDGFPIKKRGPFKLPISIPFASKRVGLSIQIGSRLRNHGAVWGVGIQGSDSSQVQPIFRMDYHNFHKPQPGDDSSNVRWQDNIDPEFHYHVYKQV